MYQQTLIIGHVGRQPELRQTQRGRQVCDFSVAVNRRWTDRESGEIREKTTWFRVTAWGRQAETCARFVRKGMSVMVEGEVTASAWIDRDGEARGSLELTAHRVKFLNRSTERSDRAPHRKLSYIPEEEPVAIPF